MSANHTDPRWWVRIWVYPGHRAWVDVNVVALSSEFPGSPDLEVGVNELRTFLAQRDPRFDSERHLYVRFFDLANDIKARWSKGMLTRS